MYRVTLTEEQGQALKRRAHQAGVAPSTRDRLEMVRLADAGWSVPQNARPLGVHEQTVRRTYKRTGRSLRHQQQPQEVAEKQAALSELEKGGGWRARPVPCG